MRRPSNPLRLIRPDEGAARAGDGREMPIEAQVLLIATVILTVFGVLMVYSASSAHAMTNAAFNHDSLYFVKNGLFYTLAGLALMFGLVFTPVHRLHLRKLAPVAFVGSVLLLAAVVVPGVGLNINGASRWLAIGPVTIQPSEFAKAGVLLMVAAVLAARKRPPDSLGELLKPIGLLVGVVCGLIMLQPDLGTTLAICIMSLGLLVVAGVRWRLLGTVIAVGVVLVGALIYLEPYRRDRMLAFLDPWGQSADGAYQVVQAMIAIGSGGIFGVGLGGSVQKVNFLPEAHTDMIFAVIGEELGLVGAILVIGLFAAVAWSGYTIAMRTKDPFLRLIAAGTTALIIGQAVVNLGAVMGALPLTGIPLPLISYGSSSRIVILALIGVLIAIAREPQVLQRSAPAEEPAAPRRARRTSSRSTTRQPV